MNRKPPPFNQYGVWFGVAVSVGMALCRLLPILANSGLSPVDCPAC